MVSNIYIQGYDRDDLAQELRLIVVKAAKLYNPNRNTIFHTYLHTAMANRLKTLWVQASKKLQSYSLDMSSDTQDDSLLEAVCVQHEIDHLDGITMFDRQLKGITIKREGKKLGRNTKVLIKKGNDTQTLKYKKATKYLENGWTLVEA